MKEMEAKTENRYEYRKPQEKRKQMIAPDLFEFAYVPDWYGHLAELERLALPESWKFRKPSRCSKADFDCGIRNSTVSAEIEDGSVLPSVNRPRRTVIKL